MGKLISMCGLDCSVCPAFVAHQTGDRSLREKTAVEWSKAYGTEITAEMIDCVGCLAAEGPHIGHCFECSMRLCGLEKGVANCGLCPDYACDVLAPFLANVPPAKANLDEAQASKK
jgi:hypothetical protein